MSSILKFTLTNTEYTPIIAPVPCDYYSIMECENGWQLRRSSDGTDEHSYVMYGAFSVMSPVMRLGSAQYARFKAGDVVTYLKLATGTSDNAIVEFMI